VAKLVVVAGIVVSAIVGCSTQSKSQAQTQKKAAALATPAAPPLPMHTITVTFNYDFSKTPVCEKKVVKNCVRTFLVYDVTDGATKKKYLFTIPAADNAKGVQQVSYTAQNVVIASGMRTLAVTASDFQGVQSDPAAAQTTITVNP